MRVAIVCLLLVVIGCCSMMASAHRTRIHKNRLMERVWNEVMADLENEADDWCPQTGTRTDGEVTQLISNMEGVKCLDEKLRVLEVFLKSSSETLTGSQVNKIVPIFSEFVFVQIAVIGMIQPYIHGLYATELVALLKGVQSSGDRIKLLEALKNTVYEVQSHKTVIVQAFDNSDKAVVENIMASAKGTNCVFGRVDVPSAVFVVDISPSMREVFQHPNGKQYTRLDFVKIQMEKILRALDTTQTFNVVAFDGRVYPLKSGLIPATPENVEEIIKAVYALKDTPVGGTNIMDAAAKAFDMHPAAIFLLSDGIPNAGITNPVEIKNKVTYWNNALRTAKGLRAIPINTISFLLGVPKIYPSSNWNAEKNQSAAVLKSIATASGGVFKLVDM